MSPIKPENKHRYGKDWNALSLKVREEAGQRCEICRVCNGAIGYRYKFGGLFRAIPRVDRALVLRTIEDISPGLKPAKLTKIVLTVHHRDGQPENNQRGNLIALCQRCHLRADRELRKGKLTI